jgi:hypothetical protein
LSSILRTHVARLAVGVAAAAAASAVSMGPAAASPDAPAALHTAALSGATDTIHPDGMPYSCVYPTNGGNIGIIPPSTLSAGQAVCPGNLAYELVQQGDGNLVIYNSGGSPIWASNTDGHPGAYSVMQNDGNFVVYNGGGGPLWATNTDGHSGAYACMQVDGNFVIYAPGGAFCSGTPLWASNT